MGSIEKKIAVDLGNKFKILYNLISFSLFSVFSSIDKHEGTLEDIEAYGNWIENNKKKSQNV